MTTEQPEPQDAGFVMEPNDYLEAAIEAVERVKVADLNELGLLAFSGTMANIALAGYTGQLVELTALAHAAAQAVERPRPRSRSGEIAAVVNAVEDVHRTHPQRVGFTVHNCDLPECVRLRKLLIELGGQ